MIRVITVSREYGSGGGPIARIVAERLGWRLVDDPLVKELAKTADVNPELAARYDESIDPWFYRLFKAIWRGGFEGVLSNAGTADFDADMMAEIWHRTIRESAELGECVIVGRGGQCLLQERADTFHVSVFAPMQLRVRLLSEVLPPGTDIERYAREVDGRRAAYVRRYFSQDWTNRHLYHLMICAEIGFERAAEAILCAAGLPENTNKGTKG